VRDRNPKRRKGRKEEGNKKEMMNRRKEGSKEIKNERQY
jgi:hypothetical protein